MMERSNYNILLSDFVEQYMIVNFNDKKTYAANFLYIAGLVWNDLFIKTFFSTKNVEVYVERDSEGYFIYKPKDCIQVLGVSVDDECGRTPLIISSTVPMEATKALPKGKCRSCDSDLCSIIDSSIVLRTEIVDGVSYSLKTFIDRLSNGDLIEVVEKIENNLITGKPEKVLHRKPLCTLEVYDCGCPKPTISNRELITSCGCDCLGFPICCNPCIKPEISSKYGYFNFDIYSDKIRLKSSVDRSLPKMLILAYKPSGKSQQGELQVPEYAVTTMFDGMKFYSSYKDIPSVREMNKRMWKASQFELALSLAPFDPEAFRKLQSIVPKWG